MGRCEHEMEGVAVEVVSRARDVARRANVGLAGSTKNGTWPTEWCKMEVAIGFLGVFCA
jgi:hypothetical protein